MAETKNINDTIGNIVEDWFKERVEAMQKTLEEYGIVKGLNTLPEDISVPKTMPTAEGISAELLLPDYYEFVDQGVKGVGNLKPDWKAAKATGRFSFKNEYVSRSMVDNIREWNSRGKRKGITVRNMNSAAFGTAKKIKRTGIRQTMFFSDNFTNKHLKELEDKILDATGIAFELSMTFGDRAIRVQG